MHVGKEDAVRMAHSPLSSLLMFSCSRKLLPNHLERWQVIAEGNL